MRKITRKAVENFKYFKPFNEGNTKVEILEKPSYVESDPNYNTVAILSLHGNDIAELTDTNVLRITNAGWFSNTTKERLNGLPGVSIHQKAGVWYLNGKEWDGEWTKI